MIIKYYLFVLALFFIPSIVYAQEKKYTIELTKQWIKQENNKSSNAFKEYDRGINKFLELWHLYWKSGYLSGNTINLAQAKLLNFPMKKKDENDEYFISKIQKYKINNNPLYVVEYVSKSDEGCNRYLSVYVSRENSPIEIIKCHENSDYTGDGIRLLKLGNKLPIFIDMRDSCGGSGFDGKLFLLNPDFSIRQVLSCPIWNSGNVDYIDLDHDGVMEVYYSTRINHPKSLDMLLEKCQDFALPNPILFSETLYKWDVDNFKILGVRYSFLNENK